VWNRSKGNAGELLERGAVEARSVEQAVTGADVVLTSLSGDDAVRDVLLPQGRARPELTGTVVDCSTVSPGASSLLADAVAAGQRAGLPDDTLSDLLAHLSVVPAALTQRIPAFVGHDHPAQFSVDLGRKDLGLFADAFPAGPAEGVQSAVHAVFDQASERGFGDDDITAVVEALR
jgi:3-hydroxyisobutyrate dehydrogenase-like beta-hydroxyacid dehydrogenase